MKNLLIVLSLFGLYAQFANAAPYRCSDEKTYLASFAISPASSKVNLVVKSADGNHTISAATFLRLEALDPSPAHSGKPQLARFSLSMLFPGTRLQTHLCARTLLS